MKNIICDIDGVLLHNNKLIPGADEFIHRILEQKNPLLLLTNYPSQTPKDLENRLNSAGIRITHEHFYTSAMATAAFLEKQGGRKAYVIGEGALTHELYRIGFTMTDINPDFVAPIERITGKKPFYIGKPNAWIMRAALNSIDAHSEDTIIIGDNMNTDILAGIQAGIETVLVLTGVSQKEELNIFPYRPNHIFPAAVDIDIV